METGREFGASNNTITALLNYHVPQPVVTALACIAVICILHNVWTIIYRFYLHPLAKFPGPKLAAITHWHEAYYDLIHDGGGQWTFRIHELHRVYGPIVRINPDELHIDDIEYYDTVYCNSTSERPIDKIEKFRYRFGIPESSVQTALAEEHRRRRAAVSSFFSKARIRSRNDVVQAVADAISQRLETEFAGTAKHIDANSMWGAMASDVISQMAFAKSTNCISAPDFTSPHAQALSRVVTASHVLTHFGFLATALKWLPDYVIARAAPTFKPVLEFRSEIAELIQELVNGHEAEVKGSSPLTLFHDALAADVPADVTKPERLLQEALSVHGGAIEAVAWALTLATFHILDRPEIKAKLESELRSAMPDPSDILPWKELEELPYLTAVVTEALRLSYGTVQRLPRVNRLEALVYKDWIIPPNTPVSMDSYHMHMNETLFPRPGDFEPDRWMGNPKGPDGIRPLSAYMVSFSRGSRNCIGLHLAWMELYVGLATVFRRHELSLFQTSKSDVDFAVELVAPRPRWDSKGVRLTVEQKQ